VFANYQGNVGTEKGQEVIIGSIYIYFFALLSMAQLEVIKPQYLEIFKLYKDGIH